MTPSEIFALATYRIAWWATIQLAALNYQTGVFPPMTSETASHTPGPWRIEGLVKRGNENGKLISHGLNHYGDGPAGYVGSFFGSFEDAALIAASPDLLKAAKRALSTFRAQGVHRDGNNVVAALEDAIAKASGEEG
jgi:hypothetical protein